MEKLIFQENEYLKSIFDSIFDEVMVLDKNFTIIDVNKTFCIEYSISKEMAVGKKCYEITHKLNEICKPPECKCPVEDVMKTGKFSESIHCHEINGEETYVELLAYPIMTEDGKIKHIVKIGRDITERKRIQNQIKESEEELNLILSNINDSVVVISKDLKILYMNKKAQEVFGDNQVGKVCYDILMNCKEVCDHCTFNKLITNYNAETRFETIYINPFTSEKRFFEYSCTPILNFNGQPASIDIIRDITDRKIAEKILKDSEVKFRKLFENFPFPIFLLDSDKKIYDYNSFAEIYMNKSKKDLINREFLNLFTIPKKKRIFLDELISDVINFGVSEIIEFKFLNHNAKMTWVELFFSSVNVGNKKFIQIVLQDITEKKLIEKIIKEENKRLRELNQIKKQLMTQISENLQSPLNNIFDLTEILLNSYNDQLDPEVINLLELIKSGGEKSINMVGKILDISQIELDTLKLNKQTESLFEIIEETVNEIDDKIKSQSIVLKLNASDDLYSEIDKIRIKQVIKHFILNAKKNGSSKEHIIISLNRRNKLAEISIKYEKIKLKNLKFQFKSGILKEIIELHGGQIIVNSERKKKEADIIIQLPIKNWKESLIHIYIIYKSGIPLYDYSFIKNKNDFDAALISGGIIGMITILKAIIRGKKQIKIIDHGDRKLMFESNKSHDIIFVLLVKEDLMVIRKKLYALINEFDKQYQNLLKNIENTSNISDYWHSLRTLIKESFC